MSDFAPTATGLPETLNVLSEGFSILDLSGIVVTDTDSDTISVLLFLREAGPVTFVAPEPSTELIVNGLGLYTISLQGTPSAITTYLNTFGNIRVEGDSDAFFADEPSGLNIQLNDGPNTTDAPEIPLNVTDPVPQNQPPTATNLPGLVPVPEDTVGMLDLSETIFADVDTPQITVSFELINFVTAVPRFDLVNFQPLDDASGIGGGVSVFVNGKTIDVEGAPEDINAYFDINKISFSLPPNYFNDTPSPFSFSVSVEADDGIDVATFEPITINVTPVNDPPTATISPEPLSVAAGVNSLDLSFLSIMDVDNDAVEITVELLNSASTFDQLTDGSALDVMTTQAGPTSVTLVGPIDGLNAYLADGIQLNTPVTAFFTNGQIRVTLDDGADNGRVVLDTMTLLATGVLNRPPTIDDLPPVVQLTENAALPLDLRMVKIADIEGDSVTVTLTASTGSFASVATTALVSAQQINATTIQLQGGPDALTAYLNVPDNISYAPPPGASGDNVAIIGLLGSDGVNTVDFGAVQINVTPPDLPPSGSVPTEVRVASGATEAVDLTDILITDDGTSVTVSLVLVDSNAEFASPVDAAGVSVVGQAKFITVSGTPLAVTAYLQELGNIQVTTPGGTSGANGVIRVAVDDGAPERGPVTLPDIQLFANSAPPTIRDLPVAVSGNEDQVLNIDFGDVVVEDIDSDMISVRVSTTFGSFVPLNIDALLGADLTFDQTDTQNSVITGSPADITEFLRDPENFPFIGNANEFGLPYADIRIFGNDGSGEVDLGTVVLSLSPVNDAPTNLTLDNFSVIENSGSGIVVGSFSVFDVDLDDTHEFTILPHPVLGIDSLNFEIVGNTLVTKGPIDFEVTPSLSEFIQAKDTGGATTSAEIVIVVLDVDETFLTDEVDNIFVAVDPTADPFDGRTGTEIVVFQGDRSSFSVTISPENVEVEDRRQAGGDPYEMFDIEGLSFSDQDWVLDIFDDVAQLTEAELRALIEVYIAYFNRAPDAEGLFFYGSAFANGTSLEDAAATFLNSTEYQIAYPPELTNREFAEAVYGNVLGRLPDVLGLEFWVGVLDDGLVTRDAFILEVLKGAKAAPPADATEEFVAQKMADVTYLENKTDIGQYFAVTRGMSDVVDAAATMMVFDTGNQANVDAARQAIDTFYADALDPENGEFLLQLVGVADNPFDGS